ESGRHPRRREHGRTSHFLASESRACSRPSLASSNTRACIELFPVSRPVSKPCAVGVRAERARRSPGGYRIGPHLLDQQSAFGAVELELDIQREVRRRTLVELGE